MSKSLSYITFALATAIIVVLFVTSQSYMQLAVAVLLYPAIAVFALNIFPRRVNEVLHVATPIAQPQVINNLPVNNPMPAATTTSVGANDEPQKAVVSDIDKRTFLKLIGATGLSFFIFSILGRRTEALLFGQNLQSQMAGNNNDGNNSDSLTSGGYRISEVDNGVVTFYGFTKQGSWFIMKEDTQNGSFRYAKGDGDFPKNWENREKLNYDYYDNIF